METATPPPRALWVDRAKGYGIILVVIGHIATVDRLVHDIFLFHMPLFFFLSGLTFRSFTGARATLAKARALLLPYVAFALLILFCLIAANAALGSGLPVPGPLHFLLGGTFLTGAFGTFWFPTALLVTLLLLNLLLRLPLWAQGAVLAATATASFLLGGLTPYNPYGLLTVGMALPFAAAGHHVGLDRVAKPDWKTLAGLALCAAAFFLLAPYGGKVDFKYLDYGVFPVATLAAAAAIAAICFVSAVPVPGVATIGRASLTIMYTHLLVLMLLKPALEWPIIVVVAVGVGVALHRLFALSSPTRRLLLGMRA